MKVCTVDEMRNLDREAAEKFLIPEELLMENAGLSAYTVIRSEFGIEAKRFVVVCGSGNNGGDGLVLGRKLLSAGAKVHIFLLGDRRKFKGAAKTNMEIADKLPLDIEEVRSLGSLASTISRCDAIVDAIFGTGLGREVKGIHKEVISLINKSNKTVFSLDIPSGTNGDTGKPMGISVTADYTISFGGPKPGNILYPGFDRCGRLFVSHIGFPPSLYEKDTLKTEISLPSRLPVRASNGHKGDFGDVLFIAGAKTYYGAPYFSALSFLKAGGGYSRLAIPAAMCPHIAAKGSEIVFVPQEETDNGSIALKNLESLLDLSEKVDMVVIGPGLSLDEETAELVRRLIRSVKKPILADGDGITALCKDKGLVSKRSEPTVLTPHLGEMSRITSKQIDDISSAKIRTIRDEAKELNAVFVLKGAHSLIGNPDGTVFINMSGNSGMATAGSGDVLTGTIAAMYGLGLSINDAAKTGVFIHGLSGDLAAAHRGEDGITAQDILDYLPNALQCYRDGYDELMKDCYRSIFIV
jgi:hydroxyethylthiazole kinase-like uncharacterized protein yjeF